MKINVMTWNMAGAKLLKHFDSPPTNVAQTYIDQYRSAWTSSIIPYLSFPGPSADFPDIILLQECIGFVDTRPTPSGRWQSGKEILQSIFTGYECFFFPAFSSQKNHNPAKWNKFRIGSGIQYFLPDEIDAQQGYGVCVRDPNQLKRIWIDDKSITENTPSMIDNSSSPYGFSFEAINLTTGMYLGNRDTEPRLAILGRMKLSAGNDERYCNFINLHLTTLQGEREGNPKINRIGSEIRLQHLKVIVENIISAYQESTLYRIPRKTLNRKDDIWIVAGDFNATPESNELDLIRKSDFIDGNPDKRMIDQSGRFQNQIGTKISLRDKSSPPVVVDYIHCGLQGASFNTGGVGTSNSRRPFLVPFTDPNFATDHAALFACFEI